MDEPPASQPAASVPPIFVNSEGSPLRVYVEATNIQGRPQFVRLLKKYGATICHEPKAAEILLVDAESTQGRMSIRNWGAEADKVVLDYTWGNKCINAGTVLLNGDYGGCLTHDDGLPIGDQDDDGENEAPPKKSQSPLPTPRQTPIEPPTKNHFAQQQRRHSSQSVPRSESQTPSAFEADPNRTSVPPPTFPVGPTMQGGVFPGAMNPMLAAPPGTPMTAQQQMTQFMLAQQMILQQMTAQAGQQFNSQQMPVMTDPLWLSMQDNILRSMMQSQQLAQLQQSATAFPHFQQQQSVMAASPVEEQALPFPSVPHTKKPRRSIDMDVDDASPSPPPLSASRANKLKIKHKQKAISPPPKRRKTSGSAFEQGSSSRPSQSSSVSAPVANTGTGKQLFATRSGRPVKFYVQIGGHNRFNLVRSIKSNGGSIVKNVEEANYVVLFPGVKTDKAHDAYCRQARSAGVPVVTPKFVNECVEEGILLDPEEFLFEPVKKIRKRALSDATREARDRTPVDPESEDEDDDVDSPGVPTPPATMKPKASSATSKPLPYDTEKKIPVKTENEKHRKIGSGSSTQAILMAARDSQLGSSPAKASNSHHREKKSNGALANTQTTGPKEPPSPIPPPESSRLVHGKGYRYSKEEIDFALEQARVMLERNHRASMNEISMAIYKKLPHHTLNSWRTHLGNPAFTAQMDELRKRAGIAYRKAQNAKQAAQQTPVITPNEPATSMVQVRKEEEVPPASPSPAPTTLQQDDLEDDLNTIAKFFADGNDDQTEEEEVIWARLTSQAPCKTKARWDDFYQTNSEEVQRRYQALLDAADAGN